MKFSGAAYLNEHYQHECPQRPHNRFVAHRIEFLSGSGKAVYSIEIWPVLTLERKSSLPKYLIIKKPSSISFPCYEFEIIKDSLLATSDFTELHVVEYVTIDGHLVCEQVTRVRPHTFTDKRQCRKTVLRYHKKRQVNYID